MRYRHLFTVFTPTYNRAQSLHKVYESLLAQTFREFEWLVVDDGSTDGTEALVREWQNSPAAWFPIRYFWQKNQHKKVAHNRGVREARGELFLVFDSDDRCEPMALERFAHHWSSISEESRSEFAGVCALCAYEDGTIVGDRFPASEWIDSDSLEMRYRFGVKGEKWGFMRTDILKNYPFPENIPYLVPEGVVWSQIAQVYKTRFINETLRIYCQDQEGLVARKGSPVDPARNAVGATFRKNKVLSEEISWFRFQPIGFAFEAARLTRFYLHISTIKERQALRFWPTTVLGKLLVALMVPAGIGMWLHDRWRMRKVL